MAMAKPLTAYSVKSAKPGGTRREIRDAGSRGLYLGHFDIALTASQKN
jgi:hypothetical protein